MHLETLRSSPRIHPSVEGYLWSLIIAFINFPHHYQHKSLIRFFEATIFPNIYVHSVHTMRPPEDIVRFSSEASHTAGHTKKAVSKVEVSFEGIRGVSTLSVSSEGYCILPSTLEGSRNVAGNVRRNNTGSARALPPPTVQPTTAASLQLRPVSERASDSRKIGGDGDSDSNSDYDSDSDSGPTAGHGRGRSTKRIRRERLTPSRYKAFTNEITKAFAARAFFARRIEIILLSMNISSGQHGASSEVLRRFPDHYDKMTRKFRKENRIREWDTELRDRFFPDASSHHQTHRSSFAILEDIIPLVEENVLRRLSQAEGLLPGLATTGEKYENIADIIESLMDTGRLDASIQENHEVSFAILYQAASTLLKYPSNAIAHLDGVPSLISSLIDSYMARMNDQLAVDLGRKHGVVFQHIPELETSEGHESFPNWLRRSRDDSPLSSEYVDWVLSGCKPEETYQCCRRWEESRQDRRGFRKEFIFRLTDVPHMEVISAVLFKESHPIKIEDMSESDVENMGWFPSSPGKKHSPSRSHGNKPENYYWRYEMSKMYPVGTRIGENVTFRVSMDDEVLGIFLPKGGWLGWEDISENSSSIEALEAQLATFHSRGCILWLYAREMSSISCQPIRTKPAAASNRLHTPRKSPTIDSIRNWYKHPAHTHKKPVEGQ
ncbi:uncharacterized protein CLUP02_02142 [Colletotrichum lupini]|uniref:Uncharacterized protein n=1 Tax=Colletotrichum lupini TaxID=145971 RepID=A0A9Q8W9C7_9PEZI|nr:uncharacterized protein CLUP02_02142 [Colletotrichum lupini]UQC75488.1 hypothetical protein CLUP02_02142 [Colletotrichum lupini]